VAEITFIKENVAMGIRQGKGLMSKKNGNPAEKQTGRLPRLRSWVIKDHRESAIRRGKLMAVGKNQPAQFTKKRQSVGGRGEACRRVGR